MNYEIKHKTGDIVFVVFLRSDIRIAQLTVKAVEIIDDKVNYYVTGENYSVSSEYVFSSRDEAVVTLVERLNQLRQ